MKKLVELTMMVPLITGTHAARISKDSELYDLLSMCTSAGEQSSVISLNQLIIPVNEKNSRSLFYNY